MTKLTLIFFLLPLFSGASLAQNSPLASCPCTLRGVVLNSLTGAPIRNALVELSEGASSSALTDSDGAFHFDSLPAGSAWLSVIKPGFLPSTPRFSQPVSFPISPDTRPALIKLVPGGVIRGHLADDFGLPLEDFSVELLRRIPGSAEPVDQSTGEFRTDGLGNFRIPDLPAGSFYLVVSPRDSGAYNFSEGGIPLGHPRVFYPGVLDRAAATPIKVSAGSESVANLVSSMKPLVRISGRVTGHNSDSSIELAIEPPVSNTGQDISYDRRTGTFQTGWIPQGTYTLHAVANATHPADAVPLPSLARLTVSATSSVSGLVLTILPSVNIPIKVSGLPRKEDVNQVNVQVTSRDGNEAQTVSVVTNDAPLEVASADMFIPSLQQGRYRLEVSATLDEPYYVESATFGSADLLSSDLVIGTPTSPRPIEIVFRKGAATLSGTVNLRDAARGAVVCLFSEKSGGPPLFQLAGGSASFRFENLSPGNYRIAAVDGFLDLDFSSTDSLKKIHTAAAEVSLAPAQALVLNLDLISLGE